MIQGLKTAYRALSARHPSKAKVCRFVISGGTATLVNVAVVYGLTDFAGLWYLSSAVVAFFAAIGTSFVLQKLWTFDDRSVDRLRFQAGVFFLVACWGLLLNVLVVYVLVEYAAVYYVLAQLIAGLLIAVQNYFAYAYLFKKRP